MFPKYGHLASLTDYQPSSLCRVPLIFEFQVGHSNLHCKCLQGITGSLRGNQSAGISKLLMGIACIPTIPVILKSPHSYLHCNIWKEFDFTGILWGFPALDVGKPCNNLIF